MSTPTLEAERSGSPATPLTSLLFDRSLLFMPEPRARMVAEAAEDFSLARQSLRLVAEARNTQPVLAIREGKTVLHVVNLLNELMDIHRALTGGAA